MRKILKLIAPMILSGRSFRFPSCKRCIRGAGKTSGSPACKRMPDALARTARMGDDCADRDLRLVWLLIHFLRAGLSDLYILSVVP